MKFYFVILHYQNINDTKNCIDSIKKLKINKKNEVKILILDNKSPNKSGENLKVLYKNEPLIEVVLLDKNYGFSKANNLGYKTAKENGADYILVLNNDILIKDNEFLEKIERKSETYENYHIIAPDIINLEGMHQNPLRKEYYSKIKVLKNLIFKCMMYVLFKIPIINKIVCNMEINREKDWLKKYYNKNNKIEKIEQFVPFGAFIIFTSKWINNENIAFPSDTFMYAEEDFLAYYLNEKKYKIMYETELQVIHLEGGSVNVIDKVVERYCFKYKQQILALFKYWKFISKKK